ncbi:tetratricopeptide repeat protein [Clostridium oryzae]|uniref:Tetratricopeptide repeat protein n=1 Tax=Clostridium oryzae TaxID=1450648 RepID=A0A1V4INJ0_9CLOT|nr:tetratricopeptide repeat protein [Clostridium oryzae]OPJ61419.1 tetratricopeptide repeat protein [Clostridium oryzae]
MDRSRKLYKKAVDKYSSGYIDDALDLCEKSISFNLKNAAAINLKGLLYYFMGDEKSARSLWKMNKDYNKDETARVYLNNLEIDAKNLEKYINATKLLKELKVSQALENLLECGKSDFNCINVYNSIASCYIYQGKYELAAEYIDKVRKIDKNNQYAKNNIKALKGYSKTSEFSVKLRIAAGVIVIVVLIAGGLLTVRMLHLGRNVNPESSFSGSAVTKDTSVKKINKRDDIKTNKKKQNRHEAVKKIEKSKKEEDTQEKFPTDKLKQYIKHKDSSKIYEIIGKFKFNSLSDNDKVIYNRAINYMKRNGVVDFYSKGADFHKDKKYHKAIAAYEVSKIYGRSHYLYPSILFMLGDCYENTDDFTSAIKCFKEYLSGKHEGGYEAQVLYKLSVIYRDIDLKQSKMYAAKLRQTYSDSIYNNSVIDKILNK